MRSDCDSERTNEAVERGEGSVGSECEMEGECVEDDEGTK